ncbi:MAG UNVERIFIED_CONTAM: hypothetical protein LVQ98_05940 [Rickettsiaceae bacterium]
MNDTTALPIDVAKPQEFSQDIAQVNINLEAAASAEQADTLASVAREIPQDIEEFVRCINSGELVLTHPSLMHLYFQYSKIIRDFSSTNLESSQSWDIDGKIFTTGNPNNEIREVQGIKNHFVMIRLDIPIEEDIQKKLLLASEKVTTRDVNQTGLKFCSGFIEVKIKGVNGAGDIRFVGSKNFY